MKSEEAPLLLNIINAEEATLDECITIISGLSKCSICKRIGELYFTSLPVLSRTTVEKEEIKHEKTEDFEENIFEAAKQGKLSSVEYLIEECHTNAEIKNDLSSLSLHSNLCM